jgi:hypothetical protein
MNDLSLLTDDQVDAMLLAEVKNHWLKTAMVIARALEAHENWDEDRVSARIETLVDGGKIECAGDVRKWRFSEVRLATQHRDEYQLRSPLS